jgi:hypothetical protein
MGRGGLRGGLVATHASKADGAVSMTPAFMTARAQGQAGVRHGAHAGPGGGPSCRAAGAGRRARSWPPGTELAAGPRASTDV